MGDPERNESALRRVFGRVYAHKENIPAHTMVTQVHSPDDEYLTFRGAENFHEFLNRGLLVSDKTETEPEFHDLKNLQPKTLIRILGLKHPALKHSVSFTKR